MNKHINHLSMRKLMGIEQKEHDMKKKPTSASLPAMEQKEHGLKSKPSMGQIQRMEQKEHIKKFRHQADVLSLTATPIPRTLNMAMHGMRDI